MVEWKIPMVRVLAVVRQKVWFLDPTNKGVVLPMVAVDMIMTLLTASLMEMRI